MKEEETKKQYEKDTKEVIIKLSVALQQVMIGYPDIAFDCVEEARERLSKYAGMTEEKRKHITLAGEEIRNGYTKKKNEIGIEVLDGDEHQLKDILSEGPYNWYFNWKTRRLDKEIMMLVEGTISKINMACLASGIPCDPEISDGIRSIEVCLDKMKIKENV